MTLTDLPIDVIVLIFPYLTACDFLSFTSCTKKLLSFRQEPTFWRLLTTRTFRVPSPPLLRSDGARWQCLYRSLITQTQLYTWGDNSRGTLAYGSWRDEPANHHHHVSGVPQPFTEKNHVGVVVDVQCGGWSTVLLNSFGELFYAGVLDGDKAQLKSCVPAPLTFPPAYPPTTRHRYEPDTATKEYSVGRSRVMSLSDSGKMWEWANGGKAGMLVKLVSVDVAEGAKFGKGRVARVASGWAGSSAYINGTGIVFWDRIPEHDDAALMDAYLLDSFTVPGTSFIKDQADQYSPSSLESRIGEVISHIILENSIVFISHLNKVFAYPFSFDLPPSSAPVELVTFQQASPSFHIEDIQGSFRNFGIISRNGAVLLGKTVLINSFNDSSLNPLPQPFIPPALQSTSVVSLAFGDYHYLALHADGTITSHGSEPAACGAFGLGPAPISIIRGAHRETRSEINLTPSPESIPLPLLDHPTLRTVWFEPEKTDWLLSLRLCSAILANAYWYQNRFNDAPPELVQAYGDWFEREGRAWHLGPPDQRRSATATAPSRASDHHPDSGAYFAIRIAAAGWDSAALVLVDPEKAERVKRKYMVPKHVGPVDSPRLRPNLGLGCLHAFVRGSSHFLHDLRGCGQIQAGGWKFIWEGSPLPRLKGPDGIVVPGTGEVRGWRAAGTGRDS